MVTVLITPHTKTLGASCKFVSYPEPDILDYAARRLLVTAMQKWLMESGEQVHPLLVVE